MCSNQQGAERELHRRGNAVEERQKPTRHRSDSRAGSAGTKGTCMAMPQVPENVNDAKDPTWGAPLAAAGRLRETLAGAFSHHMQLEEVGWGSTGSPLSPNPRPALREEPIPHSIRATGQNPALSPPQPCWRPFSPLRTSPEGQTRTLCFIHWKPRFPVLEPGGHRV